MTERSDFWARRKAAVASETEAEEVARLASLQAEEHAKLEEKSDEEILEDLGLPDPEGLQEGDDFSAFMAKAVPDRIRRKALRVLWRSNPLLANIDGLVDYGEDFTDSATVIENLQTTYQVGKGMLAHIEKLAADAEKAAEDAEQPDDASEEDLVDDVEMAEADIEPEAEDTSDLTMAEVVPDVDQYEVDAPMAPAPRRMTFTFEAETA